MAKKKYLVVHPKLSLPAKDKDGNPALSHLKAGAEVSLEEKDAKALVDSGKLSLVVAKKKSAD